MDNRPLKAKNNESGTITALLTASEVTTAHVSPVPENAPGLIFINSGTSEEECIYYKERDAGLGTISGLTRDVENQNGGVGREAQANAPWETLQSVRYVNNLVDMLIEGYVQETNDVAYVSDTSFTVKTNRSAFYTKGRIVRFDDGAIGVVSADSTYVAGTGLTTVLVTGTVPNPILTVELGIQHKGRTDVFASGSDINTGTDLYKIVTPKAIADSWLNNGYNSLSRQAIINGNFDVWQRGTSVAMTAANAYAADRWYCETATAGTDKTVSREDGTGVNGSYYCARVKMVGDVDELLTFSQALESQDSIKFRGKKVTLSFYARGGAEFVADNATLVSKIVTGKGTDKKVLAFTTSADGVAQNNTLTTGWQKFTCTTTNVIAADITQIGVSFAFTHAGSGTTTNYFEVTQVQLCAGDVALPFMPKSYEEELRACQRYYLRITGSPYSTYGYGWAYAGNGAAIAVSPPTHMRISLVTVTASDVTKLLLSQAGTSIAPTSISGPDGNFDSSGNTNFMVGAASSLNVGYPIILRGNGTDTNYISIEAEL